MELELLLCARLHNHFASRLLLPVLSQDAVDERENSQRYRRRLSVYKYDLVLVVSNCMYDIGLYTQCFHYTVPDWAVAAGSASQAIAGPVFCRICMF